MQFSTRLLKKFLATSCSDHEIISKLNSIGFEVEYVVDYTEILKNIVVAKIVDVRKHPKADSLSICKVTDGKNEFQIICGCSTVRPNMIVALAKIGAYIPKGAFYIKKSKIRDEISEGMLCSASELCLLDESSGILNLQNDECFNINNFKAFSNSREKVMDYLSTTDRQTELSVKLSDDEINSYLGMEVAKALHLSTVIKIAITPNRGDMMSVYGVARELSIFDLGKLKSSDELLAEIDSDHKIMNMLINAHEKNTQDESFDKCYFIKTDMKNGITSSYMKYIMWELNLKSISIAVDITNYIAQIFGNPSHIYNDQDLDLKIDEFDSQYDSTFVALDGNKYLLEKKDIVIIDTKTKTVQGLAGIMGGQVNMCAIDTKKGVIEMGSFNSKSITRSGQRLNIASKARQKFERGIESDRLEISLVACIKLFQTLCGAKIHSVSRFIGSLNKNTRVKIAVSINKVIDYLGFNPSNIEITLKKMNFDILDNNNDVINVLTPNYRTDIKSLQSVCAEIARFIGYDNINDSPIDFAIAKTKDEIDYRGMIVSLDYSEVITWSFVSSKKYSDFFDYDPNLLLGNPISSNLDILRQTAVCNFLDLYNKIKKLSNRFGIFEIGPSYQADINTIRQSSMLFGMKDLSNHIYDFYSMSDVLSDIKTLFSCEIIQVLDNSCPKYFEYTACAKIVQRGNIIGHVGIVNKNLLKEFGINTSLAYFEVDLDKAKLQNKTNPQIIQPHPIVIRDFSFITPHDFGSIEMDEFCKKITNYESTYQLPSGKNQKIKIVKDIKIFDLYVDKTKIVGIRIWIQSNYSTLNVEEINSFQDFVIELSHYFNLILKRDAAAQTINTSIEIP